MAIMATKTAGQNNARYVNQEVINLYKSAGIDPATGLPLKAVQECALKGGLKTLLRIVDEQDAVNRYVWHNLPANLTSQELERMLYYKGQLCCFWEPTLGEFFFMPYALDGTIDFYGRYNSVHPVPMASGTTESEKGQIAAQMAFLSTKKLKVLYDVPLEPITDVENYTVLLHDYTKQMSQTILSRQSVQEPLLDFMSETLPFMRTAMRNSTGVQGYRVNNEDEAANVAAANIATDNAALNGQRYIPIVGQIDFQELAGGDGLKAEQYLMSLQSLDNFRLSLYGLANGGLFQKNAYQNNAQTAMNGGSVGTPLTDGLLIRQHWCDVFNALTGAGVSCEISETAALMDRNMDGYVYEDGQDSAAQQPAEEAQGDVE